MSLTGASNFTISGNARLYEIHGDATINHFPDNDERRKIQLIASLPRVQASQKDYEIRKKSGPCFPGTRKALLQEMMDWVTKPGESRMYVLSGLAGIGKSTIAYTLATQADDLGLLGASFFFSRDDADRSNARKFFSTITYQLCLHNEAFANAIGNVLLIERGSAAATQDLQEQLKILILDPLRSIIQSCARPILVVVDALDECDEADQHAIVTGLTQLVRLLPSFKVILTTRPQPLVDYLFGNRDGCHIFHVQDIEDKVVDDDIRLYLSHSFSQEQVRERLQNPREDWCANEEDIASLVKAAGRLFIVASTAVLYVLDKTFGNPGAQMKSLLGEIAQNRTPFRSLNHFYSVIVHSAIQVNDDVGDKVERYQSIVGTIAVIQTPLPVTTLAYLVGEEAKNIYGMLRNLQSVILLGSDDAPRVYHKSFPDYLTDPTRCKDPHLRIDPRIRHTQIATRCFEIMNKHLKYNILSLGTPARFMSNENGLKEDRMTNERLEEKIPQQLRYACVYWGNHFGVSNIENVDLMNMLEKFVKEHMLHWLEVLSLIEKLDSAHRTIHVVLKLVQSTSLDLELLSDALRFISKFYEIIKRSALHTYYSALAFTPTDSALYRRYNKEAAHNICVISGGPEKWDTLVANMSHDEHVGVIKFSLDSSLLVCWSETFVSKYRRRQGKLKIWDATTGTPISTIPGDRFAIANNFSTVVSSEDNIISYYSVNGSTRGAMFTTSLTIKRLALSSESDRIAAVLDDGTVLLWDSRNSELIGSFKDFCDLGSNDLRFSPTGTRLAYPLGNNVKLRDGISGRFITILHCGLLHKFKFSGDGSRIASVSFDNHLKLWKSENGALIDDMYDKSKGSYYDLAISANGSLLATKNSYCQVGLWTENNGHLAQIYVLELGHLPLEMTMTFSVDNILAIASASGIQFYDVKTRSFISTLTVKGMSEVMAFSPDWTRLATRNDIGVSLWDIRGMDASSPFLQGMSKALIVLALSRDYSRLACEFGDGTVELWGTDPTTAAKQRISPLDLLSKIKAFLPRISGQFRHKERVTTFGISPNGKLLASGSHDGTIKLWNSKNGSLRVTLKVPGELLDVALSNRVLVAAWGRSSCGVTLWNLDTPKPIHTLKSLKLVTIVSISDNSALIAIANNHSHVSLLDVVNKTIIATFNVPYRIHTMTFLPDNSHLVVQSDEGVVLSLNLIDKHIVEGPTLEHLLQLLDTPIWHGAPIWHCMDKGQHYFSALFPQHKNPVLVLWIPKQISVAAWTQRSSMIALRCNDSRIILLRLPTAHVSS